MFKSTPRGEEDVKLLLQSSRRSTQEKGGSWRMREKEGKERKNYKSN
jgi:hypothetical protein